MTDYLKSFTAGEDIKASETNANNLYLLNQITAMGTQLEAYLRQQIEQLRGGYISAGMVIILPYATVPTGFLLCDGSSLLREDYPDLFSAIGTTYGAVDDYHFNLPDFQGAFLQGYKSGVSASIGTKQSAGLPNITGQFTGAYGLLNPSTSGAFAQGNTTSYHTHGDTTAVGKGIDFNAVRCSAIYGRSNTVTPENYAVYFLIKYSNQQPEEEE